MSARQQSPLAPFRIITLDDATPLPETIPLAVFQQYVVDKLEALTTGQAELTVAFGSLKPKVEKLEVDAQWSQRLKVAARILAPFLLGVLAKYIPGAKELLPTILEALQ